MHDHLNMLLPWYDSDRLSPEQQATLTAHVAGCLACQTELAQWRVIGDAVRRDYQQRQSAQITHATPDIIWFQHLIATKGKERMTTTPIQPHRPPAASRPGRGADLVAPPRRRLSVVRVAAILLIASLIFSFWFIFHNANGTDPGGSGGVSLAGIGVLSHVDMVSATEGWAIGFLDNYPPTPTPGVIYDPAVVLHYLAGKWQVDETIPSLTKVNDQRIVSFNNIAMDSPTDGWIIGNIHPAANADGQTQGILLHYTQGHWVNVANTFPNLSCIAMISADEGWAAGDGIVLHYTNGTWAAVTNPMATGATCSAMSALTAGGVWLVSGTPSTISHYDGQTWTQERIVNTNVVLGDMQMISAHEGWAVGGHWKSGEGGVIMHYANGTWQAQFTGGSTARGAGYFFAIAMVSTSEGWAVGFGGVIAHYHQGHWAQISSPTQSGLLSISMLSADDGWASGDEGGVLIRYLHGVWSMYHQ